MRDLININKLRTKYPDKDYDNFDSLTDYRNLTLKLIKKEADKLQQGLAKRILQDEDAIANIAHKIMMGDWKWSQNYKSKKGKVRTRQAYRYQCGVWAIREFIRREVTFNKTPNPESLDPETFSWRQDYCHGDSISAKENVKNPLEILIEKEEREENLFLIDEIIANSGLNLLEEACVRTYLETQDFKKVSEDLEITQGYAKNVYHKAIGKVIERNV